MDMWGMLPLVKIIIKPLHLPMLCTYSPFPEITLGAKGLRYKLVLWCIRNILSWPPVVALKTVVRVHVSCRYCTWNQSVVWEPIAALSECSCLWFQGFTDAYWYNIFAAPTLLEPIDSSDRSISRLQYQMNCLVLQFTSSIDSRIPDASLDLLWLTCKLWFRFCTADFKKNKVPVTSVPQNQNVWNRPIVCK